MKPKEYKIKTVQDMIDCTTRENIDTFLIDLKMLILSDKELQILSDKLSDSNNVPRHKNKNNGFIWIDDNKNDCLITLKPIK